MQLPILLVETDSGDVTVFDTIMKAESAIEWQDVDLNEAYDIHGQILRPEIHEGSLLTPKRVKLVPSGKYEADKLRRRILEYLTVLGVDSPQCAGLDTLIHSLIEKTRYGR